MNPNRLYRFLLLLLKTRVLLMLALTQTSDTKEIQRVFYTY